MKKKTAVIAGIIILVVIIALSSVLISVHRDRKTAEALAASTEAVIVSSDKSVFPGFIYNSDSINSDSLVGEKEAKLPEFEAKTLPELEALSGDVIRGRVKALSYTFIRGEAWTQADIEVTGVFKGGLSEGFVISVYFPGGYASVEDYNKFYGENNPGGANEYYIISSGKAPVPFIEDDVLLFLNPADEASAVPKGAYVLSWGEYSVFSVYDEGKGMSRGSENFDMDEIMALFPHND